MDLNIGPKVLALADHARPATVECSGDESRNLLRVRILEACVDKLALGEAVDGRGEDDVAFDVACTLIIQLALKVFQEYTGTFFVRLSDR